MVLIWLSVPALGQLDTTRFRVWDEDAPLRWSDYTIDRERYEQKHGFAVQAITSYQYFYVPRELHPDSCLNVLTTLRKRSSWMHDTIDGRLLEHERIHFDIAELYARKLRQQFQRLDTSRTLKNIYLLVDSLFKAGDQRQRQYDEETFYGRSSGKQRQWRQQVDNELKQLDEFSFENTCSREKPRRSDSS